jgi:hypothetical protein
MCLSKIFNKIFKKKKIPAPVSNSTLATGKVPKPLIIPHPEEAPDLSKTIENIDLNSALNEWATKYSVPETYRDYWKSRIIIKLDANLPSPAQTFESGGVRHLTIKPAWVNPGVIAHEQAHNSYALLNKKQKKEFSKVYTPLKKTDRLIVFLYSKNSYGLTSDVEGHAEIYRYLDEEMPEVLKKYYPKLF